MGNYLRQVNRQVINLQNAKDVVLAQEKTAQSKRPWVTYTRYRLTTRSDATVFKSSTTNNIPDTQQPVYATTIPTIISNGRSILKY
ncbi:24662_t:CDS:2 [Dentiscutata erythropus]|uniref:24662_t:CDS:1 n=1 Tax=Dentiscutata erythropus TaxID=1348616 RepID=A0A9N9A0T9_9GLOM|nr:24662_t:CDS:2 [Dentiscutata erythropus]